MSFLLAKNKIVDHADLECDSIGMRLWSIKSVKKISKEVVKKWLWSGPSIKIVIKTKAWSERSTGVPDEVPEVLWIIAPLIAKASLIDN